MIGSYAAVPTRHHARRGGAIKEGEDYGFTKGEAMSKRLNSVLALLFGLVLAPSCQMAVAQFTADQQKALDAITSTADRICNVVKTEGSSQQGKILNR